MFFESRETRCRCRFVRKCEIKVVGKTEVFPIIERRPKDRVIPGPRVHPGISSVALDFRLNVPIVTKAMRRIFVSRRRENRRCLG